MIHAHVRFEALVQVLALCYGPMDEFDLDETRLVSVKFHDDIFYSISPTAFEDFCGEHVASIPL